MSTSTLTRPDATDTGNVDLDHAFCCDDNKALCGTDLAALDLGDFADAPNPCIVCDLITVCPVCGERFEA